REVFQRQSVGGLAVVARDVGVVGVVGDGEGVGVLPLTPVMFGFGGVGGPGFEGFCQSVVVRVPGGVGLGVVRGVVQAVLDRHDVWRSRLVGVGEGWGLDVGGVGVVRAVDCVRRVDAWGVSDADLGVLVGSVGREVAGELDPVGGVMVRFVWFDRGGVVPGRLLVVAHHLVVDGVSWRVVVSDLGVAWGALSEGRVVVLPGVGTSFRRWARLLVEEASGVGRVGELGLWSGVLSGPDVVVGSRRLDAGRDVVGSAVSLSWVLPAGVSSGLLSRVSSVFFCGVDEVLLAGLAVAFGRWSGFGGGAGAGSLLVDVEGHGREEFVAGVDLSRTVGWFTGVYPVRLNTGTDAGVGGVLKGVKESVRGVPDGGVGFGLLRYLNVETGRVLAGLPSASVAFNYLGRFPAGRDEDWAPAVEAGVLGGGADERMPLTHALAVNAVTRDLPEGPEVSFTLTWAGEVLTGSQVQELGDVWVAALAELVEEAERPGAGGRTPSDLPLVTLTQTEIDQIAQL
ncbi:condensation domain-containing protein, partial [Streptomyces amakusaensis]